MRDRIIYDTESCKRFAGKGTLGKEFCMWSGFSKIGFNLIRKMDFKSRLVQDLVSPSLKRTKFSWNAAFDNRL